MAAVAMGRPSTSPAPVGHGRSGAVVGCPCAYCEWRRARLADLQRKRRETRRAARAARRAVAKENAHEAWCRQDRIDEWQAVQGYGGLWLHAEPSMLADAGL